MKGPLGNTISPSVGNAMTSLVAHLIDYILVDVKDDNSHAGIDCSRVGWLLTASNYLFTNQIGGNIRKPLKFWVAFFRRFQKKI